MDQIALKKELRIRLNRERKALSREDILTKSEKIYENWLAHFSLKEVNYLHVFQPIKKRNEIETSFFTDFARKRHGHVKIIVPVVNPYSEHLTHVELANDIKMEINHWGIPEPKMPFKKVSPMQMDMVLVPMLGFDMEGNRLGYGKGYYDRFLNLVPAKCLKIGLCLEQGKVENGLPAEAHDVALDYIVTEEILYRIPGNNKTT